MSGGEVSGGIKVYQGVCCIRNGSGWAENCTSVSPCLERHQVARHGPLQAQLVRPRAGPQRN